MPARRRHPHQVLVAVMCVVSGVPTLLAGPQPTSVEASMPAVLVFVWAATLVAAAG